MSEVSMPLSWRLETKPHKFCPGCGHPLVLKALGLAIDELNLQGNTVFGCDIGCSLLAWDFFDLDSVQTHHGRTTPVIVGIKRARPDLVGIAYMGDGGAYAIGAQHLVNAALRGDPITVIVVNNTVYAMTGGQMAPTTLPGQETATSPYGRDPETTGSPMMGAEMVAAIAGPDSFIARGTVNKVVQLKGYIKDALKNQLQGRFSFVEALSSCPTNWRTNAEDTFVMLEERMGRQFPTGRFREPGKDGRSGREVTTGG